MKGKVNRSEGAATRKDAGTASVEAEVPAPPDPHECCTTCGVNMNAWRCPDCHGSPNPACGGDGKGAASG